MSEELLQTLFRIGNKFNLDAFVECKFKTIQAILEKQPEIAGVTIAKRILDSEASLGEKLLLVEVIGNASNNLANDSQQQDSLMLE